MGFQLMLEQANSFYVCAKMCGNKMKKLEGRIDIYATPMIVNLSFACEVYIKTLLDYLENGSKKSHKLNELLDALPDEKKSRILKEVEEKHGALLAGASTDQTAGGYISGASTPSAAVLPDDLHSDQGKG